MFRRPRPWIVLLALWWAILFILSQQSHLPVSGPDIENFDKVEHATYFTIGGAIFFSWLRTRWPGISFIAAAGLTVLFCSVIGVQDEFHQSFIPNRSGNDPGDWAADTFGGLLGSFLGAWLQARLSRQKAS